MFPGYATAGATVGLPDRRHGLLEVDRRANGAVRVGSLGISSLRGDYHQQYLAKNRDGDCGTGGPLPICGVTGGGEGVDGGVNLFLGNTKGYLVDSRACGLLPDNAGTVWS